MSGSSLSHGMSMPYMVGKGVKQGSILSPSLFPLIIDPLLTRLQNSGLGLANRYITGYVSIISMAYLFMLVDSSMLTTLEHYLPALNLLRTRFLLLIFSRRKTF